MNAGETVRVRLGADSATSPVILRVLARDPSVKVRASLALNGALPPDVAAILAQDADERVRSLIGGDAARPDRMRPGQPQSRTSRDHPQINPDVAREKAVANLTALVAEAGLRIRTAIAETVCEMRDGPRDIVLRLAHDPAAAVSERVVRLSPMLSPNDLKELAGSRPPPAVLLAIARRPGLSPAVSDAIIETGDIEAVTALLANPGAMIRQAALESLAAQSEEQAAWQRPLLLRPDLPPRAALLMSEFVAGDLRGQLAVRQRMRSQPGSGLPGRQVAGSAPSAPAQPLPRALAAPPDANAPKP